MSTPRPSPTPSSTWFKLITLGLGISLTIAFIGLGLFAVSGLQTALPTTTDKLYWFISRSSGVLAYLLLTLAVMWGLVQSGAILQPTIPPLLAFGLHNFLSWASLILTALHALILLGDQFIKMGLAQILIPFSGPYRPFLVGIGILAFYLMLLLSISFYLRPQIRQKTFRGFHYLSFPTYLLVTWHSVGAGTDSTRLWSLYGISLNGVVILSVWRIINARRSA